MSGSKCLVKGHGGSLLHKAAVLPGIPISHTLESIVNHFKEIQIRIHMQIKNVKGQQQPVAQSSGVAGKGKSSRISAH